MRIINVKINGIKSHNETNFHPEKCNITRTEHM